MATATTLTERTKRRLPHPTVQQMAAATEILERAQGKDARADTLAPFVADGLITLHDRLDSAGLNEQKLFGAIADALAAKSADSGDYSQDFADHAIRLKATKTGLELRGLLSRGNRVGIAVGSGGQANVAVGLPWSPAPVLNDNSTVDSNSSIPSDRTNSSSTTRSTIEGTGSGRGARGHSHRHNKSAAIVPVHEMSDAQLKKISKQLRDEEQRRRLVARSKKNKRIAKHVGPNHQGRKRGGGCRSGKCGRCRECIRRAKLRLP